ncbi:MAG: hypothetical protein NZ874_01725 [Fimbriimonadales bacterium]|nr:hypothetical protein [Fimbriimonadales bacterium]
MARTVVSVPLLGHDCPSHGCLGETPKPRGACVGGTPSKIRKKIYRKVYDGARQPRPYRSGGVSPLIVNDCD